MNYLDYLSAIKNSLGQYIDFDKSYANQCVDYIKWYASFIGAPITTYGNAKDFIKIGMGPNWQRVVGEPWVGDIVIQPNSYYGHIFVLESFEGGIITGHEQNRDGNAYRNNDVRNLWSPVARGKYKAFWNEVYFRRVAMSKWSKNIPARAEYNPRNYPILNQGQTGECAWFAILACLMRMKEWVDHVKIARELIEEGGNSLTMGIAAAWFIRKGYISWIRKASYSASLLKRQPIIAQFFNVDWQKVKVLPYYIQYYSYWSATSHWACIVDDNHGTWVIANSHWSHVYDNGYCYLWEEARKEKMKIFYTLEL